MPLDVATEILSPLLPEPVKCAEAPRALWETDVTPAEARIVEGAIEARRVAFAAGRACARRALVGLGIEGEPVTRDADRAPRWPGGVVGSITHCDTHCAAAVASASDVHALGIDVEEKARMTAKLLERICNRAEQDALENLSDRFSWGTVIFSAKESVYKAYHPSTGAFLSFEDVEIELIDAERFTAHLINADKPDLFGRRALDGRCVLTGPYAATAVVVD
jgi:4'-phosphopantetheinyl transferase EntD